jgi:hypothetical protein
VKLSNPIYLPNWKARQLDNYPLLSAHRICGIEFCKQTLATHFEYGTMAVKIRPQVIICEPSVALAYVKRGSHAAALTRG